MLMCGYYQLNCPFRMMREDERQYLTFMANKYGIMSELQGELQITYSPIPRTEFKEAENYYTQNL